VAPENFLGADPMLSAADIWIPATAPPGVAPELGRLRDRQATAFHLIGRLKPGRTPARAEASLEPIARRLEQIYGDPGKDRKEPRPDGQGQGCRGARSAGSCRRGLRCGAFARRFWNCPPASPATDNGLAPELATDIARGKRVILAKAAAFLMRTARSFVKMSAAPRTGAAPNRAARRGDSAHTATLLTNGLCRRDKRRARAAHPHISSPTDTPPLALPSLASRRNPVLWAFSAIFDGAY